MLKARWVKHPDVAWWEKYFKRVHASDFLCERLPPKRDRIPFKADFEWIVRPTNFAKIIEGKYDDRSKKKKKESGKYAKAEERVHNKKAV